MKRTELKRKTPLKAKRSLNHTSFKLKGADAIAKLLGEGVVGRASTFKGKKKPIRKRAISNPGWWDVALEVWDERAHNCEVCNVPLGDEPAPIMFSHLLPRGSYRKYKRDHRNIRIKCGRCHNFWHEYGPETLQWSLKWRGVCDLYLQLRNEANGI